MPDALASVEGVKQVCHHVVLAQILKGHACLLIGEETPT
jgi:hypothetical protein